MEVIYYRIKIQIMGMFLTKSLQEDCLYNDGNKDNKHTDVVLNRFLGHKELFFELLLTSVKL